MILESFLDLMIHNI